MAENKDYSAAHSYDVTNKMTKSIVKEIEFLENEIKNLPLENSFQKNDIETHLKNIIDCLNNMLDDVRSERFE